MTIAGEPGRIAAWRYAHAHIACTSQHCECPAASSGGRYSFTYIREDLRLIYYDVPKAASSYIRKEFFDQDNDLSMRDPLLPLTDYFRFTVVRNPWDRMVSNFIFFCRSPHRLLRKRQFESLHADPVADLAAFIEIAAQKPNHHWQPQSLYVPASVDYVAKMEDLTTAVSQICAQLGLPLKPVYRVNTTDHDHYSLYYDDRTRARVAELYREDIERFGYQFSESP